MNVANEPDADVERLDPRVVRTRDAVGDAVRALLVEEGWDAVTHQRVAERAGYSRNTLYRHFPDRLSLFSHAGHFDDAVHHADVVGDVRTDLVNELKCFRSVLFDGVVGTIIGVLVERAEREDEVAVMRDRLVAAGNDLTRRLVVQGQESGLIDDSIDVEELVAELCGPLLYARLCQARRPSDAMIERTVDGVLTGPDAPLR